MRVEFHEEGGLAYFPGLRQPLALDLERLDPAALDELQRLVQEAGFFDLPAKMGVARRGAADQQTVVLTIEEGGRRRTVRVLLPVADHALRALVERVQEHAKAQRKALRSGG